MEMETVNIEEVLEEKLSLTLESMNNIKAGSEEYERQAEAASKLSDALSKLKKTNIDGRFKKAEIIGSVLVGIGGLASATATVIGSILKFRTNGKLMVFEKEDVMTSKAFDNR